MDNKEALLRIAKCMFRLRHLGRFNGHLVLLRRLDMLFDRVNMYEPRASSCERYVAEAEALVNEKIAQLEAIKEARKEDK